LHRLIRLIESTIAIIMRSLTLELPDAQAEQLDEVAARSGDTAVDLVRGLIEQLTAAAEGDANVPPPDVLEEIRQRQGDDEGVPLEDAMAEARERLQATRR
jgi:hypothetical protein